MQTRLAQSTLAPELHPLILACLESDPERRPMDANAVAKRIQEYLSDTRQRVERTETEKQVAIGKAEIAQRKNRTLRGLLAVITLLAVSVVTAITIGYFAVKRQAEETAQRERDANLALDAERKALVVTDRAMALLSGNVVKNLLSQFAKIGPDQLALLDQIGKLYFELSLVKRDTAAALENTASGHYRLADFYITHDKFQEAEPHINLAIEQYAQLIVTDETEERYRHLAASYNDRNFLKRKLGQNPEADMAAAIRTWKRIVEKYPDQRDHVWDLAVAEVDLGSWYFTLGRYAESIGAFQIPIDRLRDHSQKHPDQPRYRNTLATILGNQSEAFRDRGEMTKALRNAEEGRELIVGVIKQRPGIVQDAHCLAELDTKITGLYTESGRFEEAAERGREAITRLTRVVDRLKARLDFQSSLVEAQSATAEVLVFQNKSDEAEKLYLATTERLKLMIAQSQTVRYRYQLISLQTALAKLNLKRGRVQEARTLMAEAKNLLPAVSSEMTSESLVSAAEIEAVLAQIELSDGREAEATASLKTSRQFLKEAESARPFGVSDQQIFLYVLTLEMTVAMQQKNIASARTIMEVAISRKGFTARQSVAIARIVAQLLNRPADLQRDKDIAIAFDWLSAAKIQGWTAWDTLEKDDAFKPLTTRSEFQKLRMK